MKLTVKTSKGDSYEVEVDGEDSSVLNLKQELEKSKGIGADTQKMIFLGKLLEDQKALKDYALKEGSTVHLVVQTKKSATDQPTSEQERGKEKEVRNPYTSSYTQSQSHPQPQLLNSLRPSSASGSSGMNMLEQMRSSLAANPESKKQLLNRMKELADNPEQLDAALSVGMDLQGIPDSERKGLIDGMKASFSMLKAHPEYFEKVIEDMSNGTGPGSIGLGMPLDMSMSGGADNVGQEDGGRRPGMHSIPFNKEEALQKYRDKVNELIEIGYPDKELNLIALVYTEGDLNKAVNLLMDWSMEE